MIRIEKLGFSYGQVPVLKNITMNLEPGKIYGLLGENGVGKTTLLTLLAGLKKPLQGSIDIDGSALYSRTPQVLENQFYLADEMLPVPMKAAEYARITGEFWPNYKQDTFEEIMELFENTSPASLRRPIYHWPWHLAASICFWTSLLTDLTSRPRRSSEAH